MDDSGDELYEVVISAACILANISGLCCIYFLKLLSLFIC